MDVNEFLNSLGGSSNILSFNMLSILKLPIVVILIGNILFSFLLFIRVSILADTFKTPQNKIVKTLVLLYMLVVLVGTLLSLLFVILT